MLSKQEIARSLQGAWLLLFNKPEGLQWFDQSLEGFWRSFRVVFLLLPLFWISSVAEKKLILEETDLDIGTFAEADYWLSQLTIIGLDWIALPLLMAALAGPLGISRGYVPFVVARNWTSLLAAIPYVLTAMLYITGIIPSGVMVLLSLATLLVVLWYRFNVTRLTLQTGVGLTLGVVVLDLILSLVVVEVAGRIWSI